MSKIAFVGPKDLAGLFRSVGIDVFGLERAKDSEYLLNDIIKSGYKVIYIVESLARGAMDAIDSLMKKESVSIVIMRDHQSDLGLGLELDRRAAIDAVGTDAIFAKNEP
jgi:vacuolar-type H+-ATPase subunit F/Vma7